MAEDRRAGTPLTQACVAEGARVPALDGFWHALGDAQASTCIATVCRMLRRVLGPYGASSSDEVAYDVIERLVFEKAQEFVSPFDCCIFDFNNSISASPTSSLCNICVTSLAIN